MTSSSYCIKGKIDFEDRGGQIKVPAWGRGTFGGGLKTGRWKLDVSNGSSLKSLKSDAHFKEIVTVISYGSFFETSL